MTGRRSGRIKKNFDYTSFLENDKSDESDDDFVGNSAPPPSKKAKSSQEENIKKTENLLTPEKQKDSHASKNTKPKRKKVDEKIFERDIKMAMELSMQNDTEVVSENTTQSKSSPCKIKSETIEPRSHKELLYLSRHDIHSPPKSPPALTLSAYDKNEEKEKQSENEQPAMPILTPIINGPSDDIEFLGLNDEEEKKQTRNRRTSGRIAKKTIEYKPEDSDDSDDSEFEEQESNSEENSDFEEKPKSKKQKQVLSAKSKKESKKQPPCITSNRGQQKTESKKPASSSRPSSTSTSISSANSVKSVTKSVSSTECINLTSSVSRNTTETASNHVTSVKLPSKMQTWTPLGKSVGNITNLASPPSIRRLGLSRNQKVKPLHPTLKVNH